MITDDLKQARFAANKLAQAYHNKFITPEHMLFTLPDCPEVKDILDNCKVNIDDLRDTLLIDIEALPQDLAAGREPQHSDRLKQILDYGSQIAHMAQYDPEALAKTSANYMLLAIISAVDTNAAQHLLAAGVTSDQIASITPGAPKAVTILAQAAEIKRRGGRRYPESPGY